MSEYQLKISDPKIGSSSLTANLTRNLHSFVDSNRGRATISASEPAHDPPVFLSLDLDDSSDQSD